MDASPLTCRSQPAFGLDLVSVEVDGRAEPVDAWLCRFVATELDLNNADGIAVQWAWSGDGPDGGAMCPTQWFGSASYAR